MRERGFTMEVLPLFGDLEGGVARKSGGETMKAILTDVQFWIPAVVLIGGVVLLVVLH